MKVWDLSTRLYHWGQGLLFIIMLVTGFSGDGPHIPAGTLLFTLILWRVLWGLLGSETSQFKSFVASPKSLIDYLKGNGSQYIGHNPAGSWMVMSLMLTLLSQCITGLVLSGFFDHIDFMAALLSRENIRLIASLHEYFAYGLVLLVVLHITAIVIYKLNGIPLVLAMLTGRQSEQQTHKLPLFRSNLRAFLLLISAGLVTIAIIVLPTVS